MYLLVRFWTLFLLGVHFAVFSGSVDAVFLEQRDGSRVSLIIVLLREGKTAVDNDGLG